MPTVDFSPDYRHLFEISPKAVIVLAPDLKVINVSDEYLNLTMRRREEVVGHYIFEVFPDNPDDESAHSEQVRASFLKVFETGEPDTLPVQKYDVMRPLEEGGGYEERYWRLVTFPVFDDQKKVCCIYHHVENITENILLEKKAIEQAKRNSELSALAEKIESERREAESALEDTRLRLESALQAGEIGTWTWDVVNNRIVADKSLAMLFSVSDEDAKGGSLEKYTAAIHEDDRERIRKLISDALQNSDSYRAEYRLVKPDDSIRWVVARGSILRDESGNPLQLPGVVIDITERKNSEEALIDSEQRLKFALEAGRLGSYELDPSTGKMVCSERCLANFGLPPEEDFPFDKFLSMIHPNDRERVNSSVAKALEDHSDYEVEYQIIRPDGETAWIFARGRGIYDESGKPLLMNGVTLDITSRRQTEEKLRVSDERFQLVTRATNDAIWDWNLQTNDVWWNDAVQTMFGYDSEQVEPTSAWWYEHIHPEDRERIVSGIHEVIDNGGENWSDEYRYLCADGGFKYVYDRGFAIHRDGKPIRMLGAMQDITERRKIEEAFRQSQERLQLVLDSSKFGLWYCDLPFDVLNWSDLTKNHFWLPPEATVTIEDFYNIIHTEDREKTRASIDKSIADRTHYDVEYRTVNPQTNQVKWIRAIGRGFYDQNNDPYRFDGITIDISDDKQIQAEREQLLWSEKTARAESEKANRMKDEFLATLSHELRTPLTSILGWSRMLRENQIPSDQFPRAIETIERNAKSQAQLIEDVLDVSRIISGKMRLDVRSVNLSSIIEAAIDAVKPAAEAKNIRFQKIIDQDVRVSGDSDRLQQIVWNLLSNAIKFTPKEGRVQIKLERVNSHAEIVVSDNGIGIAAEDIPFIFERFRQSDSSTTRQFGGLGLGLAIVRHLVELHGGTVEANSTGLNQGTTFTVGLPVIALRSNTLNFNSATENNERIHPTANGHVSFSCPPEIKDLRILIVDDEPDTREILTFIFESCNALPTAVSSAEEVLELIKTNDFDILVSDIGMPVCDGYELIKNIRALSSEEGGRISAVALTAYARVEDRMRALLAGFQMHVPKPVDPAELVAVVASLVKR